MRNWSNLLEELRVKSLFSNPAYLNVPFFVTAI